MREVSKVNEFLSLSVWENSDAIKRNREASRRERFEEEED